MHAEWLRRRRNLVTGGGLIVAVAGLALVYQWSTPATLTPLLFLIPCTLMMLLCMRGMNHKPTDPAAPAPSPTPAATPTQP
jgi:hypothetical protein